MLQIVVIWLKKYKPFVTRQELVWKYDYETGREWKEYQDVIDRGWNTICLDIDHPVDKWLIGSIMKIQKSNPPTTRYNCDYRELEFKPIRMNGIIYKPYIHFLYGVYDPSRKSYGHLFENTTCCDVHHVIATRDLELYDGYEISKRTDIQQLDHYQDSKLNTYRDIRRCHYHMASDKIASRLRSDIWYLPEQDEDIDISSYGPIVFRHRNKLKTVLGHRSWSGRLKSWKNLTSNKHQWIHNL